MEAKFTQVVPLKDFRHYNPKQLKDKAKSTLSQLAIEQVIKYPVITMKEFPDNTTFYIDFVFFTRHQYKDIVRVLKDIKESMEKKEDPILHLENLCNALRA